MSFIFRELPHTYERLDATCETSRRGYYFPNFINEKLCGRALSSADLISSLAMNLSFCITQGC